MATTFSSLPIVDLSPLRNDHPSPQALADLSRRLYDVFATTGFAYLVNSPLSFNADDVFAMAREFFSLSEESKMSVAKRGFRNENQNTYRGYFPSQPDLATDNLKEGFEIGSPSPITQPAPLPNSGVMINLAEPNVWPKGPFTSGPHLEQLYTELQCLSSRLLSLLAMSLGRPADFFDDYLIDSLSTLRLLHYPIANPSSSGADEGTSSAAVPVLEGTQAPSKLKDRPEGVSDSNTNAKLSCTPHTDSGILTLLHQDSTGGLEVRDSSGRWVEAPYMPGSIVVNIGDLMAKVSGEQFVATMHRVRKPKRTKRDCDSRNEKGRFSVPFFFEPGEKCLIRSIDDKEDVVVYGEHVRAKMSTWVEFRDL